MIRSNNRAIFIATALLATACGNPIGEELPQGQDFVLTTFEGIRVPGVFEQNGENTAEILSGDFLLKDDGTCGGKLSFRFTISLDVMNLDLERECSWTQVGTDLTFTWSDSAVTSGTLLVNQLTLIHLSGVVCVTFPCPTHWTATYTRISS